MLGGFLNSAFQLGGQFLTLEAQGDQLSDQLAAQTAQAQLNAQAAAARNTQLLQVALLGLAGLVVYKLVK